ncbi:MAG: hypothetical protein H8E87_07615, partial [FCB group bacterium]|nr:hypothetical protein [FCB group bacterium]
TGEFSALRISGCGVTSETGRPELPAYTKLLRLPASGGIEFEIIPGPSHTYHDIAVYPSQPLQIDGHPVPQFTRDSETYNSDRSYPGELVERGDIAIWRDIRVVPMNFFPVQYNPLTKELRIYESIEVRISYTPEGDNEMAARREFVSSAFKPIYDALSIGVEDLIVDENSQRGSIIIITPSNYLSIVQQLAEWKQRIGYETTVVTTQQTGGSANQIKDYISDAYFGWEPPPEYVILIGDEDSGLPCFWIQGYYYPQNCTDHPFALLEGDDYFPEIFVGRISVDNTTQMTTYLNKINHYEKEPYLTQTNWYNRALMIAHYSGAESCMLTKEFCEDQVIYGGITEVENAYFPGSSYSTISNTINSGALFVNYRGYGGCTYWTTGSGNWGVSSVNSLNNGYKMPVVTGMVCGGGNFGYSNGACLGEAWIREGTPTSSDGGIAFCGPSELDTHTKWNNNLDCGLYWGIFREGINHFGPALLRAKMELWIDYPHNRVGLGTPENSVGFYFYVYNILGDPSLQFWTGQPQPITAFYDDTITLGESDFDIQLTNSSGNPITDAYVCIWKLDEIYEGSAPDDLGHLTLPMVDYTAGTMKLTVTGRNLIPLLEDIYIASNPYSLGISNITIDDDNTGGTSGNGDEMITAAETIDLHVTVKNYGSSITGTNINGFLSAVSDKISIITGSVAVGSLAPGSESTHIFRISAADDLNALNTLGLTLNLTSSQGDFSPTLWIDVSYPELSPLRYIFQPAMLEPGGQAELVDSLLNSGMCGLTNIIGVIVTDDPLITIVSGTASFCDIAVNAEGGNASDPFVIAADNNLVPGYMAQFEIAFTCDEGYSFTTIVPVSIGTVLASDPMGPDEYGYYCYDSGDTGYEQAPVYNWQVISAYQGGSGTQLTLPDYGSEQDCYTTM